MECDRCGACYPELTYINGESVCNNCRQEAMEAALYELSNEIDWLKKELDAVRAEIRRPKGA
jgi:hypothetical protein